VVGRRRALVAVAAVSLLASACSNAVVTVELPELEAQPVEVPEQTIVYDAEGRQLAVLRREFRERVDLDDVPVRLVDAVLAAEDQRFLQHAGVDVRAIARAAVRNVAAGEIEQGGSTITQQLVKQLYMPDAPRTPETKLREALLARELEREHDKDWILSQYLNTVYFGSGAYGVQAAAETYWRKDVGELDLAESALLAAIIRAPESLNPSRYPDAARLRRDLVLDAMHEAGTLGEEDAERAKAAPVEVLPRPAAPDVTERHWVDYVIRELLDDPSFGGSEAERAARLYGGGLRIHTTLRPDVQASARESLASELADDSDPDGAVVTLDPTTGEVLAAVSSVPYDQLQFDLATQGRRQPGSTFKTFALLAAITGGMHPEERLNANQATFDLPGGVSWRVRNYTRASYGRITLREATRASVNAAYARLVLELGASRVSALAKAMGIESPVEDSPVIVLGGLTDCCTPLEMAAAYGVLANLGERVPATPIDRIEDADGEVVWRPAETGLPVVEPSAAFVTTELLTDVVERGTGIRARVPGWEVAGKTGTVSDYVDAWFVGYTPTLVTSVWIGHQEGRVAMRGVNGYRAVTGGSIPADVFADHMTRVLAGQDPVPFELPDQYVTVLEIDPETGLRAAPWCPGEPSPVPRVIAPRETCPSPVPAPSPSPTPTASPDPCATPEGDGATPPSCTPSPTPAPSDGPGEDPSPTPSATSPPSPPPPTGPSPTPAPTPTGPSETTTDAGG
jgi:membrane peptidoglycan carboxypeptidase